MFALYLLFAGQLSGSELASGAVLATLVTGWSMIVRRDGKGSFRGWRSHGRPVLRALAGLAPDTLRTGAVLIPVALSGAVARRHCPRPDSVFPLRS